MKVKNGFLKMVLLAVIERVKYISLYYNNDVNKSFNFKKDKIFLKFLHARLKTP